MEKIHRVYILTCPLKSDVYAFDPTALHDIEIFFSTSTFGLWCRGISLKDKVLVTGQKKRCLIYGRTIHRTIREVFNKCRSLLRKWYDQYWIVNHHKHRQQSNHNNHHHQNCGSEILEGIGCPPPAPPSPSPTLAQKRPKNTPLAARSVGERRKFWERVMEVIAKIEKTNTMKNTWRKAKTRKSENKEWL